MSHLPLSFPGQDSTAIDTLITCPEGVSQSVWMYEHLRYVRY